MLSLTASIDRVCVSVGLCVVLWRFFYSLLRMIRSFIKFILKRKKHIMFCFNSLADIHIMCWRCPVQTSILFLFFFSINIRFYSAIIDSMGFLPGKCCEFASYPIQDTVHHNNNYLLSKMQMCKTLVLCGDNEMDFAGVHQYIRVSKRV